MKLFLSLAIIAAFAAPVFAADNAAVSQPTAKVVAKKKKEKKKKKKEEKKEGAAADAAGAAPAAPAEGAGTK